MEKVTEQNGGNIELPQLPESDGKVQAGEVKDSIDEWEPTDPDAEGVPHRVAVGIDRLWDADVSKFTISPVFWKGPSLRIHTCKLVLRVEQALPLLDGPCC